MLGVLAGLILTGPGHTIQTRVTLPSSYNYNLYLPDDYATETDKTFPLLMFLHGSGEAGDDFDKVNIHGPPMEVEKKHRKFPFILVSPQFAEGNGWDSGRLATFLNAMEATYRVDKTREYVTGLSVGGDESYELAVKYPDRFAAVAPICGGYSSSVETISALSKTPLYVVHGDRDPIRSFDDDQALCTAVKVAGGDVVFVKVHRARHDVWDRAYGGKELYDWLLKHQRMPSK
jgi:predicted peptidase